MEGGGGRDLLAGTLSGRSIAGARRPSSSRLNKQERGREKKTLMWDTGQILGIGFSELILIAESDVKRGLEALSLTWANVESFGKSFKN